MNTAKKIASKCTSITDDDRCEAAAKVFECMKNEAIARGTSEADL